MKGASPCKAFSCSCRSVSWGSSSWGCARTTLSAPMQDRLMGECFFFFCAGWGWSRIGSPKVAAPQRNLHYSLNSLLSNLPLRNVFHLQMLVCHCPAGAFLQLWKTLGPRSALQLLQPLLYPSLLPTLCPVEMRHWQIFISTPIPARARRSPLFYFTDQALSQDEGFVCASLCSSAILMQNWCTCGPDNPFPLYKCCCGW